MLKNQFINKVSLQSSIDSESYLVKLPIIKFLIENKELVFNQKVTFFVGENGSGKSTLLEAIAIAYGFNAEGGSKNFNFSTHLSYSELHKHLLLSRSSYAKDGYFLRAESFYNVASNIDELDSEPIIGNHIINSYGGKSLHDQSHGESFMSLIHNRFSGHGLYILDEPEAALSPIRLMTLLTEIKELVNLHSQFIIATHSPILMAFPDAEIYEFSESGVSKKEYKETANYQITKDFLNNPEKYLKYLFE